MGKWVGKVQNYADVIYGWYLSKFVELLVTTDFSSFLSLFITKFFWSVLTFIFLVKIQEFLLVRRAHFIKFCHHISYIFFAGIYLHDFTLTLFDSSLTNGWFTYCIWGISFMINVPLLMNFEAMTPMPFPLIGTTWNSTSLGSSFFSLQRFRPVYFKNLIFSGEVVSFEF